MMYKFVLVVALCAAQGFAFKPRDKFHGVPPYKTTASDVDAKIPQDLKEAMREMDEVTETVSMAAVEAYFNGNDPQIIVECFRVQKGNFSKLGQKIYRMMREANREMVELLGDDYEKYASRIEGPLKTIGMTMTTYPVKMWLLIKEKEFSQAMEVMRESRAIILENSKVLAGIMKEMAEEFPECAERVEELTEQIREEAKYECRAIGQAFRKCVEEGGPKKLIENGAGVEEELQVAPEQ